LKSFYASVECVERGYDPLNTNLVVADDSRTDKTICLAVSPALKSFGVPGRPRLFEVIANVKDINNARQKKYHRPLKKESIYMDELNADPSKRLSYVVARPRMQFYIDYSTRIYNIYLKYIAKEDIHVYSIDEVFIDVTGYLNTYKMSAQQLAMKLVNEILLETGITATVGIGNNLYLAKIAMDIEAKHMQADKNGVRIATLNEQSYKEKLWDHTPLTDFWRVGRGISKRLNELGLYTMGDVARCSIKNEDLLFKEFGINAELLIDHAWGKEPVEIKDIKAYIPSTKSLSVGQVLPRPYLYDETKIIIKEMVESLVLDMVEKKLVTDMIVLNIGYDIANLKEDGIANYRTFEVAKDFYGRAVPKGGHGTIRLDSMSSSSSLISQKTIELFEQIADQNLLTRRINIAFGNLQTYKSYSMELKYQQFDIFSDPSKQLQERIEKKQDDLKELRLQEAMIKIKNKYGKNALLKGTSYESSATSKQRNKMIGGHKA